MSTVTLLKMSNGRVVGREPAGGNGGHGVGDGVKTT